MEDDFQSILLTFDEAGNPFINVDIESMVSSNILS